MSQEIQNLDDAPHESSISSSLYRFGANLDHQKFTLLKKHIELKIFDSKANQLAQWLIPYGETNYNCWYVKKMCFLAGVVSFQHQMQFSQETLYEKVKNFQLWEHRRFLLQHNKQQIGAEYQLINDILKIQPKNYHAWSHRNWILDQVQNYPSQLQFTHIMLGKDPYNNSVWAYRSYLIKKLIEAQKSPQEQQKIVDFEVSYCMTSLKKHLSNQAAWNYLRGYFPSIRLKNIPSSNSHTPKIGANEMITNRVIEFIKFSIQLVEKTFKEQNSVPKLQDMQAEVQLLVSLIALYSQNEETLHFAKNTALVLAEKDQQKRFYWKWVAANL